MFSFKIDYKKNFSELCKIGAKYNTDKSPLKQNLNDPRHTHPYTLFYDGLFKNYRNKEVTIAELGILEGSSLLMWNEYFPNSKIYGFEYNEDLIKSFKQKYNNLTNISLHKVNVKDENNISEAFRKVNVQYDIIIEDTTHEFQDQIRVIRNVYKYLKPGGILIIEDILNKKLKVKIDHNRIRPEKSEVNHLLSNNTKAKKLLNWEPQFKGKKGFEEGIRKTIQWFSKKENLSLYKSNIYNV